MALYKILQDMTNAEYTEWVPMGTLAKGLAATVASNIIFLTVAVLFLKGPAFEDYIGIVLAWEVLGFILFVFWNFRGLRIQNRWR